VSEEKALSVGPAGIEVAYERLGDLEAPPVLLVMGIGASCPAGPTASAPREHPGRVGSLTSMMSTTGDGSVGQAKPEALAGPAGPPPASRQEVMGRSVKADDLMCDASGGRATAEAVPGAELVVIDGMGHDLSRALWPEISSRITELIQRAEVVTPGD
jgi:hypothetical protein